MKPFVLLTFLGLSLMSCNAQNKEPKIEPSDTPQALVEKDSEEIPKGTWKVTKELDENGNVIKYDSIYSYSYGNANGQEMKIEDVDSLIQSFRAYSKDRISPSWDHSLLDPFWEDSRIEERFFNEEFFQDRWKSDFESIQNRMKQMDSLRAQFFHDYYPGLKESKPTDQKAI